MKLKHDSPLFWLCHGTSIGNVISLAGEMSTFGLPNDLCTLPVFGSVKLVSGTNLFYSGGKRQPFEHSHSYSDLVSNSPSALLPKIKTRIKCVST